MPSWSFGNGGSADYSPLISPPKEPQAVMMWVIDTLSWVLPISAAALSIGAGVQAMGKVDDSAAMLGITAGIASALGVLFTGWASRIRDGRLAVAHSLAALGLDMVDQTQGRMPRNF